MVSLPLCNAQVRARLARLRNEIAQEDEKADPLLDVHVHQGVANRSMANRLARCPSSVQRARLTSGRGDIDFAFRFRRKRSVLWVCQAESRHEVSHPEAIRHLPGACRNLP